MRDPGSGFARFHGAGRAARRLAHHIGSALAPLLLASCSGAPPLPSTGASVAAVSPGAAVEPRRVLLSYLAPPPCPGDAGFIEHVQRRSTRLQLEPESRAAALPEQVHVIVEPDPSGTGWLGELRIAGTSALVREVRGARCDDVVAALALITVLRLERSDESLAGSAGSAGSVAGATTAGEQTLPAEASAAGQLPAATNAEAPPEAAVEAAIAQERTPPEVGAEEQTTPRAPPDVGEEQTRMDADAEEPAPTAEAVQRRATSRVPDDLDGSLYEPAIPTGASAEEVDDARSEDAVSAGAPAVRGSIFGHLGYSSMPSHAFKAALGAELRLGETVASWSGALSLAFARGSDLSADGTSELTLLTTELRLCPPGVSFDVSFWLRGCGQLSGGLLSLSLSPSRVLDTEDVDRPWVALGPSVDAGLPLTSRWTLRATSALMIHLIRDTFGRAPTADDEDPQARVPLYRPEAMSLELLLGIGYTF